jgi:hypothetical protein
MRTLSASMHSALRMQAQPLRADAQRSPELTPVNGIHGLRALAGARHTVRWFPVAL